MKKILYVILALATLALAFWGGWYLAAQQNAEPSPTNTQQPADTEPQTGTTTPPSTEYTSVKGVKIVVTTPIKDSVISNPLGVSGTVPGSWSFEASFPVKLLDASRTLITQTPAKLNGDWMTDQQVPFAATLPFQAPTTKTGYLILEKDNPSGLTENEDSVEIPIKYSE